MSARTIYINFIFIFSLTGSYFTSVKIAGISLSGLVTLSAVIIPMLLLSKEICRKTLYIISPFLLFCIYDVSSFLWQPINLSVVQDATVWVGMLFLFIISSYSDVTYENINRIIKYSVIPFLIYMSYFMLSRIDSPATMMISLIFFSYFLSQVVLNMDVKKNIILLVFIFITPIVTGSRIIYISEVVIFFIIFYKYYGVKYNLSSKVKLFYVISAFFLVFIISVLLDDHISEVMSKGDNTQVAGVNINTSGRAYMWEVVWRSAKEKIVFGHGTDVAPEMLNIKRWQHPHNDYLRLLHHSGLVGLFLWIFFFTRLSFVLLKNIKSNPNHEHIAFYIFNLSVFLLIIIVMLTDNPIVYSYVMYPFAIISGISVNLGLKNRSSGNYIQEARTSL